MPWQFVDRCSSCWGRDISCGLSLPPKSFQQRLLVAGRNTASRWALSISDAVAVARIVSSRMVTVAPASLLHKCENKVRVGTGETWSVSRSGRFGLDLRPNESQVKSSICVVAETTYSRWRSSCDEGGAPPGINISIPQ